MSQVRPSLTEREHEVLAGLSNGKDMKEVAADLGISYESAKTYLNRAKERYDVTDRKEALLRFGLDHQAGRCWLCTSRAGAKRIVAP